MVRDTPPCGHAPTYQLSLTYLERQKSYGPDKKILFKKQLFDFEVKDQGPTKVITVCNTPPYGHAPTYQIKQYVSLRSKGRHNYLYVDVWHCYVFFYFFVRFLMYNLD